MLILLSLLLLYLHGHSRKSWNKADTTLSQVSMVCLMLSFYAPSPEHHWGVLWRMLAALTLITLGLHLIVIDLTRPLKATLKRCHQRKPTSPPAIQKPEQVNKEKP